MCHHWIADRDEAWERELEDLHEEDPEAEGPEGEAVTGDLLIPPADDD
jgi:hypothetical protein